MAGSPPALAAVEHQASPREALHTLLEAGIAIMNRQETEVFARFILREQADPTEAFDVLYAGIMGRALGRVRALLVALSGGRLCDEEAGLRAMLMLGQRRQAGAQLPRSMARPAATKLTSASTPATTVTVPRPDAPAEPSR